MMKGDLRASRIGLNRLIVDHTNREAESQRESVAIEMNKIMSEMKRKGKK